MQLEKVKKIFEPFNTTIAEWYPENSVDTTLSLELTSDAFLAATLSSQTSRSDTSHTPSILYYFSKKFSSSQTKISKQNPK